MKIQWRGFVLLFTVFTSLGLAATVTKPKLATNSQSIFDSTAIKLSYTEGEFEFGIAKAKAALEKNSQISKNDSVFLCKYLAVMIGADEAKKENSKFYMHKLLTLDSSATLMNLYASDAIYKMFETVKIEFKLNNPQKHLSPPEPLKTAKNGSVLATTAPVTTLNEKKAITKPASEPSKKPSLFQNKRAWALGGVALAGVGIGVFTFLSSNSGSKTVDSVFQIQRTQNP